MDIDWGHMAATVTVIGLVLVISEKTGLYKKGEKRFSWKLFGVLVVALFVMNLLWPYGS